MSDAVIRSTEGRIGILTINNPPVNALAAAVRAGIKDGAIVLIGGGRTFIAGADIREFGKPPSGPNLNEVIATLENSPKPVVAAMHGTAARRRPRDGARLPLPRRACRAPSAACPR
jgi:3-hydroxyacyl-CoA dehydrogenase